MDYALPNEETTKTQVVVKKEPETTTVTNKAAAAQPLSEQHLSQVEIATELTCVLSQRQLKIIGIKIEPGMEPSEQRQDDEVIDMEIDDDEEEDTVDRAQSWRQSVQPVKQEPHVSWHQEGSPPWAYQSTVEMNYGYDSDPEIKIEPGTESKVSLAPSVRGFNDFYW